MLPVLLVSNLTNSSCHDKAIALSFATKLIVIGRDQKYNDMTISTKNHNCHMTLTILCTEFVTFI